MHLRNIPSIEHFFIGVGSDESIDMAIRVFCRPGLDKILITPPTYGSISNNFRMYKVCANINDVGIVESPLTPNFQLNIPEVL
jgi:histidinol-phosphate aminotransferase